MLAQSMYLQEAPRPRELHSHARQSTGWNKQDLYEAGKRRHFLDCILYSFDHCRQEYHHRVQGFQ